MLLPIAYEGEGMDGYRDQIVTCDVGVSLHSKAHPLFTQCYAYHYSSLFPVLFLLSLLHSLVSTLSLLTKLIARLLLLSANQFFNVRGENNP